MKSSAMNSSSLKTVLAFRYLLLGMLSPPKQGKIQCELTSLFMIAHFTEKRFFFWWRHRPARPSTHNTWNGGRGNNGDVNNNQNTGGGNGGSNS